MRGREMSPCSGNFPRNSQWKCPTSRGAATTISESATSTSCCPEPFRRIPGLTRTLFGRFAAWASSVSRRIPEGRSTTPSRSARTVGCRRPAVRSRLYRFRGISTMDREKSSFCRMPTTTPAYWGRSDLYRPHVLVANAIYELPAPPGPRLIKAVLGGWSARRNLSGTVRRAFLRAPQRGQRRSRARQR